MARLISCGMASSIRAGHGFNRHLGAGTPRVSTVALRLADLVVALIIDCTLVDDADVRVPSAGAPVWHQPHHRRRIFRSDRRTENSWFESAERGRAARLYQVEAIRDLIIWSGPQDGGDPLSVVDVIACPRTQGLCGDAPIDAVSSSNANMNVPATMKAKVLTDRPRRCA